MDVDETQTPLLSVELQTLSTLLEESAETLASGSQDIQRAAIQAAKHIFDLSVGAEASSTPRINELLGSLAPSQAPRTRSKAKAQNVDNDTEIVLFKPTPITSLYVDSMDDEQIWAQLDLRTENICRMLDFVLEGAAEGADGQKFLEESGDEPLMDEETEIELQAAIQAYQEGEHDGDLSDVLARFGLVGDGDEDMEGDWDNEDDSDISSEDVEGAGDDDDEEEDEDEDEEGLSPLRDHDLEQGNRKKQLLSSSRKQKGKNPSSELDDGFFNLAEFNADTERAEAKYSTRGRLSGDDSDDDEDVDVDLFANVDLNGGDEEGDDGDGEALYYRDFFEPPSRSTAAGPPSIESNQKTQVRFHEQVRVKKIKATGKNRSLHDDSDDEDDDDEDFVGEGEDEFDFKGEGDEESEDEFNDDDQEGDSGSEDDDDIAEQEDVDEGQSEDDSEHSDEAENQRSTITRLKQDLFADEDEEPDDDMTTHEKRMSSLKEQIADLEAENVAPKEWTLMGEAGSRSRPQNSLLEEDLEFERVMKAVPVTTEESVKSLEETIRARILENRFDDVIRIRPLEDKPFLPSKFFELSDKKSSQSLAQIYENDYIASQAGGPLPDDRDGKLAKEHEEINALWENICGKLDALCNAHFVPKQPKATISTVSNTATATLESALPTTKSTSTMLAPEEVFSSSGPSRARSELTPAEKHTQRSKERKQRKRQRDALEKGVDKFAKAAKSIGGVKKQKQAALDSIVKHGKGVTVVGKQSAATSKRNNKK